MYLFKSCASSLPSSELPYGSFLLPLYLSLKLEPNSLYDEASQITVEEDVPSLFRTHQTIVGDEMQMPPTNFFSSSSSIIEEDDDEQDVFKVAIA